MHETCAYPKIGPGICPYMYFLIRNGLDTLSLEEAKDQHYCRNHFVCLLQSPETSYLCDDHGDDADDEDDYDDGFANNVNANRSVEIIAQEGEGPL